jgi:predicted Rossmann fold flavoprotein
MSDYVSSWDIIVIGGGPSGMMAAVAAVGESNLRVALLEKNLSLGCKMQITGGGRCNLTNTASLENFLNNVPGGAKFLIPALSAFSANSCIDFFQKIGVPTKVEEEGRVFPASNQANDVVEGLKEYLVKKRVKILNQIKVSEIIFEQALCRGVVTENGDKYFGSKVILATGGKSYPATGSAGEGYSLAGVAGHSINKAIPGLVPLVFMNSNIAKAVQGISVSNATITLLKGDRKYSVQRGDIIFTHFGLSGPAALKISREVSTLVYQGVSGIILLIDLFSENKEEELFNKLSVSAGQQPKRKLLSVLKQLVPERLAMLIFQTLGLDLDKKAGETGKAVLRKIICCLKRLPIELSGTRPLKEAMVTVGGIAIKEVNPRTMGSRLIEGLYFAGEVLDIDGYTGGYNMQIAFSTGWLAGISARESILRGCVFK